MIIEENMIERLRGLDLTVTDETDDLVRLVFELLTLGRTRVLADIEANVSEEDRTSFLHPDIKDRVTAIGQRIHDLTGGTDIMRQLFESHELQSFPGSDRQELEWAWDGIGDWQA